MTDTERYIEDPDHVPDPTDMLATLDTSGTGGHANESLDETTNVFQVARAQDLDTARRALDPDDPSVSQSLVILPPGEDAPGEAKRRVLAAADAVSEPDLIRDKSPAQEEAAQSEDDGEDEGGVTRGPRSPRASLASTPRESSPRAPSLGSSITTEPGQARTGSASFSKEATTRPGGDGGGVGQDDRG